MNLKALRRSLGYTLEDVAHKLYLSAPTISNIESGKFSNYLNDYVSLLDRLEYQRLREQIRKNPGSAAHILAEWLDEAADGRKPDRGPAAA